MVIANVRTFHAGAVESGLAFAFEIRGFRHQNAVGVGVAVGLALCDCLTRVCALSSAGRSHGFRTVIGWAGEARCLLSFRLVEALFALDAHVHRSVQVGARSTDRQRALFDG